LTPKIIDELCWGVLDSFLPMGANETRMKPQVAHLTEWLRSIDPQVFTLVLINRIMHDRNLIYAYIYLCTGLQPSDRLPSLSGE
jgi:hypothetical protein